MALFHLKKSSCDVSSCIHLLTQHHTSMSHAVSPDILPSSRSLTVFASLSASSWSCFSSSLDFFAISLSSALAPLPISSSDGSLSSSSRKEILPASPVLCRQRNGCRLPCTFDHVVGEGRASLESSIRCDWPSSGRLSGYGGDWGGLSCFLPWVLYPL